MTRKDKALEVLRNGGYFRKALETQYRGSEKLVTRLRDKGGNVVGGIGYKTWAELYDAGLLSWRQAPKSTTWPSEYVLSAKGAAEFGA
jgi:hypothetical protein